MLVFADTLQLRGPVCALFGGCLTVLAVFAAYVFGMDAVDEGAL